VQGIEVEGNRIKLDRKIPCHFSGNPWWTIDAFEKVKETRLTKVLYNE
jgi:hypothetical protein